jgi:hypothetical protein
VRIGARPAATAIALAIAVACAASGASAAVVTVVVESTDPTQTVFSGPVDTAAHPVDGGDGSGPHRCSGPSGAAPSPTATGALDDAMRAAGISWRGNWDPSFEDFFIERIGPYASTAPDRYWALAVNGRFTAGGCLTEVGDGDTVRFSYGPLYGGGGGTAEDPEAGVGPAPGTGSPGGGKGGGGGGRPRHADPGGLRRIAHRAAGFLRGAGGPGANWGALALALRRSRGPTGAALRLAARLRALPAGRPLGRDVDFTALGAWALAARGRRDAARRAAKLLLAAQSADGGFPAIAGGDSNAQSTGVTLVALRVTGLGPRPSVVAAGPTPLDYLASLAQRDGSIAYSPKSRTTPVWVTAQALLGLTTRARLLRLGATGAAG